MSPFFHKTGGAPGGASRQPAATLALIVALHLAALYFWPSATPPNADATGSQTDIAFIKPLEPAKAEPQPSPQKRPVRRRDPIVVPLASVPFVPSVQRETTVVVVSRQDDVAPVEAEVAAVPTHDDILFQARKDIGKIDRELRKTSLNLAERSTVLKPGERERLIAGAFIGRGPPPITEEVMADGRRRSRRGSMCAYKESNGLVGGRDVFSGGIKTRWEQCPK